MIENVLEIEKALKAPFEESEIEWRISRCGKTNDGKVWAKCLAYVSNRAIMDRLDAVFGFDGWSNMFREWKNGNGQICCLRVRINDVYVSKEDGAGDTDFESLKGGLSDSMKRAAVQFGIGRYLYNLDEYYAVIDENGKYYHNDKKNNISFKWNPPKLPTWALPAKEEKTPYQKAKEYIPTCPVEKLIEIANKIDSSFEGEEKATLKKLLNARSLELGV